MKVNRIICDDCIRRMKRFPDNYFDGIVTDPPYGLGFMGKDWDTFKQDSVTAGVRSNLAEGRIGDRGRNDTSPAWVAARYDHSRNAEFQQWFTIWATEALRVCKPGAIMLIFGGTRTYHRLTCAIEDAGWQIRDCMMWLFGQGFPKSLNISKAIDKAKGAKRTFKCKNPADRPYTYTKGETSTGWKSPIRPDKTNPATDLAKLWDGYGTALKPAWEPIVVAMKPLDGTFAHNAEKHGVTGMNIDGGRIRTQDSLDGGAYAKSGRRHSLDGDQREGVAQGMFQPGETAKHNFTQPQGRWPANLILDLEAAAILDEQSGKSKSTKSIRKNRSGIFVGQGAKMSSYGYGDIDGGFNDSGGASRFFYCAKASRAERNAGLEGMEAKPIKGRDEGQDTRNVPYKQRTSPVQNTHPTVKPLKLMEYLCTLLKPPTEHPILLDPFAGSGTTLIAALNTGWQFIGIEKEPDYCKIATARVRLPLIRYRVRQTKARNK